MIRRRLVGLAASLAIVAILAGMPIVLVAVGGNPIPTQLPTLDNFLDWFTTPDDGTLALNAIILGGWLVWAFLAFSIVAELIAAVRGVRVPAMPGLRMPQDTARRLVATAALLFAAAPAALTGTAMAQDVAPPEPAAITRVFVAGEGINDLAANVGGGPTRDHLVQPADTLSSVAETYLGDADRWPEVFEASQGVSQPDGRQLTDPDVIDVGWTLRIPAPAEDPVVLAVPDAIPEAPAGRPVPSPSPASEPCAPSPAAAPAPDGTTGNPPRGGLVPSADQDTHTQSAKPTPAPVTPTQDDEDADQMLAASWLLSGLAGGIVLSASALLVLRSRRRQQRRERRPGRAIATPPPVIVPVEKTITAVGTRGLPTVERMDEALCRFAEARTSAGRPMPKLVAVEVGGDGLILYMAEPVTDLTGPWQQVDANALVWRLPANTDLAAVGYLPEYPPAPYPLLVTCGSTDDDHIWLLNLEQLATIQITGDPVYTEDFLRYLVTELAVNPWSRWARVTSFGLDDDLALLDPDRLTTATTIQEATRGVMDNARFSARLAELVGADTATGRAGQLGDEAWGTHVLIVHTDHPEPDLDQLVDWAAQHPGATGTAIIISGPAETPAIQAHLTPQGRTIIESLGLNLVAVGLTSDEARGCAALLAVGADTQDVPMPVDTSPEDGWRALADQAGALRTEYTIDRSVPAAELPEAAGSLIDDDLPLPEGTDADDVEQLAPKVAVSVRSTVELADPTLDADVADWFSTGRALPRLSVLGPVTVRAHGEPIARRKPFYTEVLAFIALRKYGATLDELADALGYTNQTTARTAAATVRNWLGENPRTGRQHLPSAKESAAAKQRGMPVYQVEDLLIDADLFKRLRVRGQARGADGIDDLATALGLVTGRPFDMLRTSGWTWLADTGLDQHMVCAVVDVAHLLTIHYLQTGQIDKARAATETALLAAPSDSLPKLDLAAIFKAEGHIEEARRIVKHEVCNVLEDDGIPADIGDRAEQILAGWDWLREDRRIA